MSAKGDLARREIRLRLTRLSEWTDGAPEFTKPFACLSDDELAVLRHKVRSICADLDEDKTEGVQTGLV